LVPLSSTFLERFEADWRESYGRWYVIASAQQHHKRSKKSAGGIVQGSML